MSGPLISARLAAQRLGVNELMLAEIAHSKRLPVVISTSTRQMWISENDIEAYRMAIAESDDR
jgi:hypothetical protein